MTQDARIAALPCWRGTPRAVPLAGGLSNEIFRVDDDAGAHVLRFGADYPFHHVSRAREAMVSRAAHAAGFAPEVQFAAPGVMVTAFVEGATLTAADVTADIDRDPARLATLLRRFHTDMPGHVSGTATLFWPFHVVRDYARTLRAGASRFAGDLDAHLATAQVLEAAQIPLPIVFGHNDLLPANLLDDGARLWLIDYEYAAYSTALFDLAGLASNAGLLQGQSHALLAAYFGMQPAPALLRSFDAMQCAALLREAMWAMVSDLHLSAPGADYGAYAKDNLARLGTALDTYYSRHGKAAP